jgi:hypothetical protein
MILKLERKPNITICCPLCNRNQEMRYAHGNRLYFPIAPFCCDAMRFLDTPEWNDKLDLAIRAVG